MKTKTKFDQFFPAAFDSQNLPPSSTFQWEFSQEMGRRIAVLQKRVDSLEQINKILLKKYKENYNETNEG